MIEEGTLLQNRYRVKKQIGQGGMGAVFVAKDERFSSTVAIKETFFEDENLKKAFEREARLLNSLKHPALPQVSDYFTDEDGQFIVMEYIAGEDLSEMMEKKDEAFALEDVLQWGGQLCDALKYLHSQEMPVIHRDIKPQNLKLTPSGQIILLDFGLAKGNPIDSTHQTAAQSIFGYSRNYASLEQMQGTGTDPRSDLYSLAATLYHLASGVPPADALTRAMNVLNAQSDPLIPAHLVEKNIPGGVAEVLQKTMALNASERPASAVEMRKMLDECDKTIIFDEAQTAANKNVSAELLTQDTKLMSATTNVPDGRKPDLKTAILGENSAENESIQTLVIGKNDTSQKDEVKVATAAAGSSGNRLRSIFAIALGLFLVVGVVSAFFMYSSENTEPEIKSVVEDKKFTANESTTVNANIEIADPSDEMIVEENPKPEETFTVQENVPESTTPKMDTQPGGAEKAKTNNKKKKTANGANSWGEKTFVINDGEDKVVFKGNRIETDEAIIENGKVILKHPPNVPRYGGNPPPLTPEELKRLTPKQRQQIRDAMKLQKQKELQMQKDVQKRIKEAEQYKSMPIPPPKPKTNETEPPMK